MYINGNRLTLFVFYVLWQWIFAKDLDSILDLWLFFQCWSYSYKTYLSWHASADSETTILFKSYIAFIKSFKFIISIEFDSMMKSYMWNLLFL